MIWYIVAFFAGMVFWYWMGSFIVRNIFHSGGKWMKNTVRNMPQETLLKMHTAILDEIESRKKGVL